MGRSHPQRFTCAAAALQRRREIVETCTGRAGLRSLSISESLIVGLGILEIACTIAYLIPRISVLGAILMTAYLGGATATNVRVGDLSSYITVIFGVFLWGGLYLRDDRLGARIPLGRPKSA